MKTRAFTLVELIIVIAVIGVLAAILIPVFSNVIDKANAKSALSDAKNSMEQVIAEGTENEAMPENILIIVKKAKNFYVYGFNRLTDGCLYQSRGNPFRGFSDVQSLINARSWNALQGNTAPDLYTAYTDHDTYGYFYLVPYSGGTSQEPSVRAFRAASDYPEISDPINGLMTENMGDDVHIYHGVLTDKVNTEAQTQGGTVATPTPAATPTPVATPTAEPTQSPRHYSVKFHLFNYNGTLPYDGSEQAADESYGFDLVQGANRFTLDELISSGRWPVYHVSSDYCYVPVAYCTHTPLEYIDIVLDDVNQSSVEMNIYTDLVRSPSAVGDETVQRYTVEITYPNIVNNVGTVYTVLTQMDLHLGANIFTVAELETMGVWAQHFGGGSMHYVPVEPVTNNICDEVRIYVYTADTSDSIRVEIYTELV